MRVRIVMAFEYDLPDSVEEREKLYGVSDPSECVKIDYENDPAMWLVDTESVGEMVVTVVDDASVLTGPQRGDA